MLLGAVPRTWLRAHARTYASELSFYSISAAAATLSRRLAQATFYSLPLSSPSPVVHLFLPFASPLSRDSSPLHFVSFSKSSLPAHTTPPLSFSFSSSRFFHFSLFFAIFLFLPRVLPLLSSFPPESFPRTPRHSTNQRRGSLLLVVVNSRDNLFSKFPSL